LINGQVIQLYFASLDLCSKDTGKEISQILQVGLATEHTYC